VPELLPARKPGGKQRICWHDGRVADFDLCVIGSGSGNSIVDERFGDLRVALVEGGTFGGTCINVGCIPTKMLVYPADLARTPAEGARLGVDLALRGVRWADIRDRVFGRIDEVSSSGRAYREDSDTVTLFSEHARFVGPKTLELARSGTITADRFVIAAGSRAVLPDLPGLDSVDHHTSDTVMRLPRLPASMLIMGGGYIAAEFAHIFAAYGTAVTVVNRSGLMLRKEDHDIAQRFTELLGHAVDVRLNTKIISVEPGRDGLIRAQLSDSEEPIETEILLLATGRAPNGDTLQPSAAGVDLDDDGYIVVDDHQRTTAPGIFALGDVCTRHQFKHVANHEARVVQHNLLHPTAMIASDHRYVPHAVFSMPQVAAVGLTERQAREQGIDYRVGWQDYGDTAYGWAMEDVDHFVKIITDAASDLIVGAHLIGPQASSLIQPLIQAMSFGLTARDMARGQYWIHPAMAEVIENALLTLEE
jgi:mycothione reductase